MLGLVVVSEAAIHAILLSELLLIPIVSFCCAALIGKVGGCKVISEMINNHKDKPNLLLAGFRALGNLGFCKDNIPIILHEGGIQVGHTCVR